MQVLTSITEMRAARQLFPQLGLVPTMGALHAGHIHIVEQAREACGAVAVSLFVNPTQFHEGSDFERYPRTVTQDLALLEAVQCDLVFLPTADLMYPSGFATQIDVGSVSHPLEGAKRPGHFLGVATVVTKLINIVQPDCAFFGQKDAQQLAVIRRLAEDLNLPCAIVGIQTIREADGLALSSRNVHLTPAQRREAPRLFAALSAAKQAFDAGEIRGDALRQKMRDALFTLTEGTIDYVSLADPVTLLELDTVPSVGALASLAVRFGNTRLIDNLSLI